MQLHISRPARNVGREDRLIRAVLAGCLLTMAIYGLAFHGITLIALLFLTSGGYCLWSAATGRCFAYARLAIDTRSEAQAEADARRAADQIDLRSGRSTPTAPPQRPQAPQEWGHPALGK